MHTGSGNAIGWRPRLRYWRGHGIHSPFVYALVREVFLPGKPLAGDIALLEALTASGIKGKTARQLHNLYIFGGYGSFSIDGGIPSAAERHMRVVTEEKFLTDFPELAVDSVLCVVPRGSAKMKRICRKMVDNHAGISIDKRRFYLYFYAPAHQKQHYKL